MSSTHLLNEKVALVTGSAHGLGRAIVGRFAEHGAHGLGVDLEAGDEALPSGWRFVRGDVRIEADIREAVSQAVEAFGRLDVVVANAGVVPPWSETADIDLDEWDRVFAVNVRGVMATIKHAVPAMHAQGGSIVAMASQNARRGHPRQCLYTASKHAVHGIVRATALDLGRYGIRVNAIGPGPVATAALRGRVERRAGAGGPAPADAFAEMASEAALGRIATETEIADVAVFLASDLAAAQTGTLVPVDGGLA